MLLYLWPRASGGICHSRYSRRECKIFASGVNFSRNNSVCYMNEGVANDGGKGPEMGDEGDVHCLQKGPCFK